MFIQPGTRSALLVETKDKNGNVVVLIYHLEPPLVISTEVEHEVYQTFGDPRVHYLPVSEKITIEAYLGSGRNWDGGSPFEQAEIEPSQLAIESNDSDEIVVEYDDSEEYA